MRMVGELLVRQFKLSSGLSHLAPAQHRAQLAATLAAAATAATAAAAASEGAEMAAAGMYKVAEILQERLGKRRKMEYLVRWEEYSPEHNSWEPESLLKKLDALKSWKAAHPQATSPNPAGSTS